MSDRSSSPAASSAASSGDEQSDQQPHNAQLVAFHEHPQAPSTSPELLDIDPTGRLILFDMGGNEYIRYIRNDLQRAVLRLPGLAVTFINGRVQPNQLWGMRDSYANAFLIQSRGTLMEEPCAHCRSQMEKSENDWASPFPTCRRLPGHFGGSCANCKWRDHGARCSLRDNPDDSNSAAPARRRRLNTAGTSAQNPIKLEDTSDDDIKMEDDSDASRGHGLSNNKGRTTKTKTKTKAKPKPKAKPTQRKTKKPQLSAEFVYPGDDKYDDDVDMPDRNEALEDPNDLLDEPVRDKALLEDPDDLLSPSPSPSPSHFYQAGRQVASDDSDSEPNNADDESEDESEDENESEDESEDEADTDDEDQGDSRSDDSNDSD